MPLVIPSASPVSQRFAGAAASEFPGYFVNASDGRALKAYGSKFPGSIRHEDLHQAIDQFGALGTYLAAIEAGTVVFAGLSSTRAKWIKVMIQGHDDARYSFDHCNSFLVGFNDKVAKGQAIARMGKTGIADGVHNHFMIELKETGSDGKVRWMAYDPARFYPPRTFRYGASYRAQAIANGWCDKDGYLHGGSHLYDDRIYPIRSITVNAGVNVRKLADKTSEALLLTTAVTPATQINEVPGGEYELGGVTATLWAKVRLPIAGVPTVGFVAKPLIK